MRIISSRLLIHCMTCKHSTPITNEKAMYIILRKEETETFMASAWPNPLDKRRRFTSFGLLHAIWENWFIPEITSEVEAWHHLYILHLDSKIIKKVASSPHQKHQIIRGVTKLNHELHRHGIITRRVVWVR